MSCIVCEAPPKDHFGLCPECRRSYDRARAKDTGLWTLIEWAAKRARKFARKERPLTVRQAMALCARLEVPTYDAGMGYKAVSDAAQEMAAKLTREHPPYVFRVIQCHDREYTYVAFTVKKPDPREYEEMKKRGEWTQDGYRLFKKKR